MHSPRPPLSAARLAVRGARNLELIEPDSYPRKFLYLYQLHSSILNADSMLTKFLGPKKEYLQATGEQLPTKIGLAS